MELITKAKNKRLMPLRFVQARRGTLFFILLFMGGLVISSGYTAADGEKSLIAAIVLRGLEVQATQSFRQLFIRSILQGSGILVYLYFCSHCNKGGPLVYLAPFGLGLSVGAVMTSVLCRLGLEALPYLFVCVALPGFLEAILYLAACRNALKLITQLLRAPGDWHKSGEFTVPMGFYAGGFLALAFIKSMILVLFSHLLPL